MLSSLRTPARRIAARSARVLITGGTRGIGYAAAEAFLRAGSRVAVCGRTAASAAQAETTLREHGAVFSLAADVCVYAETERLARDAAEHLGGVDVLVNCAGIGEHTPFREKDAGDIKRIIDTNLTGTLFAAHATLPYLHAGSTIVTVASTAGLYGVPGMAAYSASKFGILGFTEALAGELIADDIYVYAVCPGRVAETDADQQRTRRETVAARILDLASGRLPLKSGESITVT